MKRRIYLIRHGLTLANKAGVVQTLDDPLSDVGIEQAGILAGRFSKIVFDSLVSSDLSRAKDTAQTIAARTGHAVSHSTLLRESPYPSSLFGMERYGPEIATYYEEKGKHMDDPEYRFGDEETFNEIRRRAKDALEFLEAQEGTVVAVSHGIFIRKVILWVLFQDALTERQELLALRKMLTNNTGITALELRENGWDLLTWNDHAHLG